MSNTIAFIDSLSFNALPDPVVLQAKHCLMDLLGVAVAGHSTKLTQIMGQFVTSQYAGATPMLFSDNTASLTGAALFGGMLIDSIDAHDGQVLTKGHVGVAVLPALLALMQDQDIDGETLLTNLVVGYEIATRAGIALHASAADYHTSGAWNGLGVVAICARLLKLTHEQTQEALGIAEFYGPRSQMMRCIDHPTMLKDGSGWGALAGTSAALLAQSGFTGSPAITLFDKDLAPIWDDLGERWYILEQYFKAYPVCRWAQPAVEAVRQIADRHAFSHDDIETIEIFTFHEGTRLHVVHPDTTEQAQYSLPFSVASALYDGIVTVESIAETTDGLFHPARRQLSSKVVMHESAEYNALFPAERWAHAKVTLKSGQCLTSTPVTARGNPENPLTEAELIEKFRQLTKQALTPAEQDSLICQSLTIQDFTVEQVKAFEQQLYRPLP